MTRLGDSRAMAPPELRRRRRATRPRGEPLGIQSSVTRQWRRVDAVEWAAAGRPGRGRSSATPGGVDGRPGPGRASGPTAAPGSRRVSPVRVSLADALRVRLALGQRSENPLPKTRPRVGERGRPRRGAVFSALLAAEAERADQFRPCRGRRTRPGCQPSSPAPGDRARARSCAQRTDWGSTVRASDRAQGLVRDDRQSLGAGGRSRSPVRVGPAVSP